MSAYLQPFEALWRKNFADNKSGSELEHSNKK